VWAYPAENQRHPRVLKGLLEFSKKGTGKKSEGVIKTCRAPVTGTARKKKSVSNSVSGTTGKINLA